MEDSMVINIINLSTWQEAISMNPNFTEKIIHRSREERVLSVCKQSKEHGFAVRFWEGIIDKRGSHAGINLAFKKIVRWAKEQKLPKAIIAEDDIVFSAPGAWQYYLENMPSQFDIYSGGIYSGQIVGNRIMNGYSGNTLITVHQKFYDFFLSLPDDNHLDRRLGNHAHEKLYLLCLPFCVYQIEGYSDRTKRHTQHEAYLQEMKFFGR